MKNVLTTFMIVAIFTLSSASPCKGQNDNKLRKTPPPKDQSQQPPIEIDIVLVLDNSGSMKTNDPDFLTRDVVTNFVDGLGDNSRLGMVIFGREATLAEPLACLVTTRRAEEDLAFRCHGFSLAAGTRAPHCIASGHRGALCSPENSWLQHIGSERCNCAASPQ